MKPALTVALLAAFAAGCTSRIVVEIPEAQVARLPAGPRVAITHVTDKGESPGLLGRLSQTRYDVRPVPADLFTQALRAALVRQGCQVIEIPDPETLDREKLRAFLSEHGITSLVRGEVVRLSLRSAAGFFGSDHIESMLNVAVVRAEDKPEVSEIVVHEERRWGGLRALWNEEGALADITEDAVNETVSKLLSQPAVREAIGL